MKLCAVLGWHLFDLQFFAPTLTWVLMYLHINWWLRKRTQHLDLGLVPTKTCLES